MASVFQMHAARMTATNEVTLLNLGLANTAVVRSLTLTNADTAATAAVDLYLTIGTATDAFYVQRYTQLTANQTVQAMQGPLVLNGGDQLKLSGGTVSDLHVIASVLKVS
jgi:hypothetical protein